MGSTASKSVCNAEGKEMCHITETDPYQGPDTKDNDNNYSTDAKNQQTVGTNGESFDKRKTRCENNTVSGQTLFDNLTKKQEIVPNLHMFQMVDQLAANTPEELSSNLERLLTYLMSSCTTTLHIIRIFYMWITNNISQLRIPCSLIHGVLKHNNQSTSSLRQQKNKPNHAWALVFIQSQWRFVDCACGSRTQDNLNDSSMTREFYFLPDPGLLINSHYPMGITNEINVPGFPDMLEASEALQMLGKPFSFGQFCRQAKISLTGLDISLQLLTHLSGVVRVDKGEQLSFRSSELEDLSGVLTEKSTGKEFPQSVLCMRISSSEYRIVVKPQYVGTYRLDVLGKIRGSVGNVFQRLVDYEIIAQEVEEKFSPFPNHFGVWGANPKALQVGFSRRIFKFDVLSCRTGDLYIKLPLANCIRVKAVLTPTMADTMKMTDHQAEIDSLSTQSTLTLHTRGVVHIKARFASTGFFSLALLAQNYKSTESLTSLTASPTFVKVADYLVSCRRRSAYSSPLPKCFPMSQHNQCLLLEPLHRDLIVNHTYNFRVTSSYMQVLKVEGELMIRERRTSMLTSKTSQHDDNDRDDEKEDEFHYDIIDEMEKVWSLKYTPTMLGSSVYIYGSRIRTRNTSSSSSALSALFVFRVVEDVGFGRKDNDEIII